MQDVMHGGNVQDRSSCSDEGGVIYPSSVTLEWEEDWKATA